tara:strand:- start:227 stop:562 length:336 start_codon:yes stop_codon:yes gene_type:complete
MQLVSQEYEITSENIQINTEENTIIYENKVVFKSENIKFKADILNLNQDNETFSATGAPIKISFFDGTEFIEGQANAIKVTKEKLILSEKVIIVKAGNKIRSEKMIINLDK